MANDSKYAAYSRETALCVDFAYEAMEEDIRAEWDRASGPSKDAFSRLLKRLEARRAVISGFMVPAKRVA